MSILIHGVELAQAIQNEGYALTLVLGEGKTWKDIFSLCMLRVNV